MKLEYRRLLNMQFTPIPSSLASGSDRQSYRLQHLEGAEVADRVRGGREFDEQRQETRI